MFFLLIMSKFKKIINRIFIFLNCKSDLNNFILLFLFSFFILFVFTTFFSFTFPYKVNLGVVDFYGTLTLNFIVLSKVFIVLVISFLLILSCFEH